MKSLGIKSSEIPKQDPVMVSTYEELLVKISKLSYDNPHHVLYFRGQSKDHLNQANATSIYPSIYRGRLESDEIKARFRLLDLSSNELVEISKANKLEGIEDIERRKIVQWSIIQHYEICDTPLLDMTHSLRIACTFAVQKEHDNKLGYVYVLAMPYLTNRITINSEEDLLLVRLLSISPPDAKRPYFQEGYLSGTTDITDKYSRKEELDFNLRLIGKYVFANDKRFWGKNFSKLKEEFLYPSDDKFRDIAEHVKNKREQGFYSDDIGKFLSLWNELERKVTDNIPDRKHMNISQALTSYVKNNVDSPFSLYEIDNIRRFRNRIVHDVKSVNKAEVEKYHFELKKLMQKT